MNRIPVNWALCRLGEICSKPQYGWTCKATKAGKLRIVRTSDISRGNVDWETLPFCGRIPEHLDKYKLGRDDILVSRAGSVGVSVRVDCMPCDAVFASYLIRFRPLDGINPKYLEFYLKSQDYWNAISELSAGIAVPNVNASKLSKLIIPIAPLHEQHRIAAKLEELLAKVDKCKERLERIPAILKRFRQAVLQAAATGKLTHDWRTENLGPDSSQLPYNDIVENGGSTKGRKRYASSTKGERQATEARSKPRCGTPQELWPDPEFSLPIEWDWVSPAQVCKAIVDCPHSTPKWLDTGELCLRTTNFRPGYLDLSEVKYVSKEAFMERTSRLLPEPDDVVYSREGGILGVAAIIPNGIRVCLGQRMMLFRAESSIYLPGFLMHVLNSPPVLKRVQDLTGGTASPHLNVGDVKRFPIPFPSLQEQQEIVRRVEALFKIADQVEARYRKAKAVVDKLTQSILAKAFRGELVPQDPNDEPASELLKRIRGERAGKRAR